MTVYKSTGKTQSKFKDQSYFDNFSWSRFQIGDIVWLEDYRGEVDRIAGVFVGFNHRGHSVVRLLSNRDAKVIARNGMDNIAGYNDYLNRKYLEGVI